MDPARRRLAERLRDARLRKGLSQEYVARRLGVPRPAISHIESGNRRVEAIELAELARMYGLAIGDLMAGEAQLDRLYYALVELDEHDQGEVLRFVEELAKARQRS